METDEGAGVRKVPTPAAAGAETAVPAPIETAETARAPKGKSRWSRCWSWVRVVLTLLEIASAAKGQVAVAAAAKAVTIVGDAVFARPGQ